MSDSRTSNQSAVDIAIVELEAVEREIGIPSKALPLLRALRLASEPSLGRWISVQDDRPEPEVFVICWNGKRLDIEWFGSKHPREFGYTHWLAFPMPPGAASDMYDGARAFL